MDNEEGKTAKAVKPKSRFFIIPVLVFFLVVIEIGIASKFKDIPKDLLWSKIETALIIIAILGGIGIILAFSKKLYIFTNKKDYYISIASLIVLFIILVLRENGLKEYDSIYLAVLVWFSITFLINSYCANFSLMKLPFALCARILSVVLLCFVSLMALKGLLDGKDAMKKGDIKNTAKNLGKSAVAGGVSVMIFNTMKKFIRDEQ